MSFPGFILETVLLTTPLAVCCLLTYWLFVKKKKIPYFFKALKSLIFFKALG